MRQHLKNQCLEMLKLLEEAQTGIINSIEKSEAPEAVELLAQCQQGAVSIGTIIESSEGEGTEEVHELEEYCEAVWQYSEELKAGGDVNLKQMEKRLSKSLNRVSSGISGRIPTERTVVFLPYKASMWDSLESVWKKMNADPSVTALVIPIPYYDKNPDGTFKEVHFEIDGFPKDVPVTDFRDFDLESQHPDAIYIHNPYDDRNYVTSVHPDFYSSKLKNYTDELVYIPYFVLGEIDPSDKEAVESIEHFIVLPAVINAHKVIVQSKTWRQVYINVMTREAGKDSRPYWEQKIDGSGSPKFERVKNLKKEDFELPSDWEQIVKKPDGSRKKIIFYNIGVDPLLKNSDKMIDKIRRVLEIFKENKDEVALLWRPHPLMQATLTSMRPELWESYSAIVNDYRTGGWGIYDDSPELDRAIAVSDAYYGDWSSVVQLYKETGKPIMIQNVEI